MASQLVELRSTVRYYPNPLNYGCTRTGLLPKFLTQSNHDLHQIVIRQGDVFLAHTAENPREVYQAVVARATEDLVEFVYSLHRVEIHHSEGTWKTRIDPTSPSGWEAHATFTLTKRDFLRMHNRAARMLHETTVAICAGASYVVRAAESARRQQRIRRAFPPPRHRAAGPVVDAGPGLRV